MKARLRRSRRMIEMLESRQLLSVSPWGSLASIASSIFHIQTSTVTVPPTGGNSGAGGVLNTGHSGTVTLPTWFGIGLSSTTINAGVLVNNGSSSGTLLSVAGSGTLSLTGTTLTSLPVTGVLTLSNGPIAIGTTGTLTAGTGSGGAPILTLNGGDPTITGGTIVLSSPTPPTTTPPISLGLTTLQNMTVTVNAPAVLQMNLASATLVSVKNIVFNGAGINITNASLSEGFYKILKYTGTVTGADTVTVTSPVSGFTLSLDTNQDPGYVDVHVVATTPAS